MLCRHSSATKENATGQRLPRVSGLSVYEPVHLGEDDRTMGAVPHSARTVPIVTLRIPGTPLQTTPITEACMIHSNQHHTERCFVALGPRFHSGKR